MKTKSNRIVPLVVEAMIAACWYPLYFIPFLERKYSDSIRIVWTEHLNLWDATPFANPNLLIFLNVLFLAVLGFTITDIVLTYKEWENSPSKYGELYSKDRAKKFFICNHVLNIALIAFLLVVAIIALFAFQPIIHVSYCF